MAIIHNIRNHRMSTGRQQCFPRLHVLWQKVWNSVIFIYTQYK